MQVLFWNLTVKAYFHLFLLPPILLNPVPCRADGLLGDAHDAAHDLFVHNLVEDEEEYAYPLKNIKY